MIIHYLLPPGETECWSFLGVKGLRRPPMGHDSEQESITLNLSKIERVLYDLEKWFRLVFVICCISQWMKRSKHGPFIFLPKKTLKWRRHFSIGQSCWSMMSKRSIYLFPESSHAWSFSHERLLNQPEAMCVYLFDKPIKLLYFCCCFCFVHAFSFQSHTKIALYSCIVITSLI